MTVLAMHQPNFLPWIGFFHKMSQVDIFVLMDTAQVSNSGSWANRAMVKMPKGPAWLTLPIVRSEGRRSYRDQKLATDLEWPRRAKKMLQSNYSRSPHYAGLYSDCINAIMYMNVVDAAYAGGAALGKMNFELIQWLHSILRIKADLVELSHLNLQDCAKEELPVRLCERFSAGVYLSGTGAKSYNQPELFGAAGVELRYQEFKHPVYPQPWGDFLPNLSIIDLLFNCGPDAEAILKGA